MTRPIGGGRPDTRSVEAAEGRAWARAWRERNRAKFDALYGPATRACPHCGGRLDG